MRFGRDQQRTYSKRNYGTLHYEEISSPFLLCKHYLDILGRVVFNYCDKYLIPLLFDSEDHSICFDECNDFSASSCFSEQKRKIKENVFSLQLS